MCIRMLGQRKWIWLNLQDFHDLNEKPNFAEGILLPFTTLNVSVYAISAVVCWGFWGHTSQLLNLDHFLLQRSGMLFLGKCSNNVIANSVVMELGFLENAFPRFLIGVQPCIKISYFQFSACLSHRNCQLYNSSLVHETTPESLVSAHLT